MKKAFLLLWSWGLFFVTLSAQDRVDSLFYLNGKIEVVTIVRNSSEAIECNYIGEDFPTVIGKDKLHKIVFKSGRVEVCNEKKAEKFDTIVFANGDKVYGKVIRLSDKIIEYYRENEDVICTASKNLVKEITYASGKVEKFGSLLNVKVITSEDDWEDVVITYNIEDTYGFERVKDISEISSSIGASAYASDKAIKSLKKEAAELRCGLVLVNSGAHSVPNGSWLSSTHYVATAYRVPTGTSEDASDDEIIAYFYNDKIYLFPDEVQEKYSDVFEERIEEECTKVKTQQEYSAVYAKYAVFKTFLDSDKSAWRRRAAGRVESELSKAAKRVGK